MRKNTVLGIVIPERGVNEELLIKTQLDNLRVSYRIRKSNDVKTAVKNIATRYVCIVEPFSKITENCISDLMNTIHELNCVSVPAVISPTTITETKPIYGYKLEGNVFVPREKSLSGRLGLTQAVYIPGSIVKRKYLLDLDLDFENMLDDSLKLSAHLWSNNRQCMLEPRHGYFTRDNAEKSMVSISELGYNIDKLVDVFRKEALL